MKVKVYYLLEFTSIITRLCTQRYKQYMVSPNAQICYDKTIIGTKYLLICVSTGMGKMKAWIPVVTELEQLKCRGTISHCKQHDWLELMVIDYI